MAIEWRPKWGVGAKEEMTTPEIERYKRRFGEAGIEPPEAPEKKVGTLQKIFGFLQRGEAAPAAMATLKGEDTLGTYLESTFGAEPEERVSFYDVFSELGWKTDPEKDKVENGAKRLIGLMFDIFGDPKTYLTFGAGGAAKVIAKIGGKEATVALSKTGSKFVRKLATNYSKELEEKLTTKGIKHTPIEVANAAHKHAIRGLGAKLTTKEGPKFIAKDGLKFMGKQVLPKKLFTTPFRGIGKVINKTPIIKSAYSSLEKAFVPFAELNKTEVGGHYAEGYKWFERNMRRTERAEIEKIAKLARNAEKIGRANKIVSKDRPIGTIMSEMVEAGEKTGIKELDDILEVYKKSAATMLKMEKERGLRVGELPNYLRHYLTPKAKDELLEGTNVFSGLSKRLRVKLDSAEPRQIMGTLKDINKWSKKQNGYNLFEPDFFKAWAVRESEHLKAVKTSDFLYDAGRNFGKKIKPVTKEVRLLGGKVVKRKTYPPQMIEGTKWITSKSPQLEGVYFPEAIVKHIDDTYGNLTNEESLKSFMKLYDKALGFWKGTVTGIWPAFHTRNFIGGSWNNYLEGVSPAKYLHTTNKILQDKSGKIVSKTGKEYSYKDVKELFLKLGGTQPGQIDVMRSMDDLLKAGKLTTKIKDAPKIAMEAVETRLRMPLFIDRLAKGDIPEEAMKRVFASHFDYLPATGLTKFERTTMKRLVPFYVWARNNVPYQLSQLVKQPGKYAALAKTQREFNKIAPDAEKEIKYMPNWMSEMFFFRLPIEEQALYLQLDLPMEDLNKLPLSESGVREIVSLLSPALKYPIEVLANKNLYFDSEVTDKDVEPELQTSKCASVIRGMPEPIKKFLNFKEGVKKNYRTGEYEPYFEMDSIKLHTIRTFLGRFYSTFAKSLEEDIPLWAKVSRYVGGVPVRELKLEEEKYRREKEYERLLRETSIYYKQRHLMPYTGEKPKIPLGGLKK